MENQVIISPSPHIHSGDSISKNMYGVLIALVPTFLVSLYFFGLGALITTVISVVTCLLCSFLIQKFLFKKKPEILDGSDILTGVLLAFNLPSNIPFWIVIVGAIFAIGVAKMTFGGLGKNIFNPAIAGRVFLLISFPAQMTTWPVPGVFPLSYMDAETGATILSLVKNHATEILSAGDAFIGQTGGSFGEVSELALLIGFGYLLYKKIITWHIPVAIIGTVAVFAGIFYATDMIQVILTNPSLSFIQDFDTLSEAAKFDNPLILTMSGGLFLGAIFMATDYVTSPMTKKGMVIYGIGIGVLTVIIRRYSAYPEGMSFAILIMNALTPAINNYVKPKHFGGK
ncbi:MAG: RnfABCDGE type electron transport complex subunit D [Tannerella sp.]|nr:RnfABCDGE type electron transport complex subunit D [Tannerella sp.]